MPGSQWADRYPHDMEEETGDGESKEGRCSCRAAWNRDAMRATHAVWYEPVARPTTRRCCGLIQGDGIECLRSPGARFLRAAAAGRFSDAGDVRHFDSNLGTTAVGVVQAVVPIFKRR